MARLSATITGIFVKTIGGEPEEGGQGPAGVYQGVAVGLDPGTTKNAGATMNDQLKAILENPAVSAEQKQRLQAVGGDHAIAQFSDALMAILRTVGKSHLIDVTAEEWSKYSQHRNVAETMCEEFWQWHCPDDEYLELLGESARWHWERVRDNAATDDVRAHALAQIKKLEGIDGN
jgi:hypothetical protein